MTGNPQVAGDSTGIESDLLGNMKSLRASDSGMKDALKFMVWLSLWPISDLFMDRPEEAERPIGVRYIGAILLGTAALVGLVVLADRMGWLWN